MAHAAVANNLGGHGSPELKMTLAAFGEKGGNWKKGYELNYGVINDIPGSTEVGQQWSAWNIFDYNNSPNYYGTLNLSSDGESVWISELAGPPAYSPPEQRSNKRYIADFSLQKNGSPPFWSLVAGRVYADLDPSFPDACPASPAKRADGTHIVLNTKGAKILNDKGGEVVLKGLNRPSLEWSDKGQYLSPLDITTMRGWRANVIRIPLNRTYWAKSDSREKIGSYKQIVDAMIYYAIENKMAVILDLHSPSDYMATPEAIEFWEDIATTYRDFGTVLFDLFNEPWDDPSGKIKITEDIWLSGGDGYVGYQKLFDTVRKAGANNLCLVGGLDYAYRLDFVNDDFGVKGTGLVYASHPYNKKGIDPNVVAKSPLFDKNFAGVLKKFPVIFTEFGCNLPGSPWYDPVKSDNGKDPVCEGGKIKQDAIDYYSTVIGWVNTNGFHYTAWGWWVDQCQPWFPSLIGNFGGDAINGGVVVKEDLKEDPGKGLE